MRKFLLTFFIVFCTLVPAHAASIIDIDSECASMDGTCTLPGCYLDNDSCKVCQAGYYCSDGNKRKCPRDYPQSEEGAQTEADCYKECDTTPIHLGTIGLGRAYSNTECDTTTITCVDNAERVGDDCKCNEAFEENTTENTCDPKVFKITLLSNGYLFGEESQTIYTKCKSGFAIEANTIHWQVTPPINIPEWWGQTFEGYFTSATGGDKKIDEHKKAVTPFDNSCLFIKDTTLYAHWKSNPYTVTYSINGVPTTQECYWGQDCTVQSPKQSTEGKVLKHWRCDSGCTGNLQPGEKIPTPEATQTTDTPNIQLTAVLIDCPAGYYCSNGNQEKCPNGSTSDGGASDIDGCYIGTDKTVFRNADGSTFTLPHRYYYLK